VTNWHLDLDTLGSYSYFKVGTTPKDFALLGKPIDRKLWLSGEHTTAKGHGSVQGAHQAGERAAREVLAAYQ
jgi:monoamine oxidase